MADDLIADLERFGISEGEVQQALSRVKVGDVDHADLYFESRVSESVSLEEGIVKRATKGISQGVGVRATAGEKTGYADRKSTRLNPSHMSESRMPSSA